MNNIDNILRDRVGRRAFLTRMGALGLGASAAAALAGCGGGGDILGQGDNDGNGNNNGGGNNPITDADILNFALNLEYLEAEYYLRGAFGTGLSAGDVGGSPGNVTGGRQVTFADSDLRDLFRDLALDEQRHVRFLRSALGGAAVARPAIDLENSFNAAAQAAGLGNSFDPFANETNFLLGAFLFEDVGVTAYNGAAPLLTSKTLIEQSAGILAAEAYHAGALRLLIYEDGGNAVTQSTAISDARDQLDGAGDKDQPVVLGGEANTVPTDSARRVFARTTSEVLRIVYLGGTSGGGFLPSGANGRIRTV